MTTIDLEQWAGWTPVHMRWTPNGPLVDWCSFEEPRFNAPFFAQDVEGAMQHPFHLLFRRQTSLDVLAELHTARPGLTPSGFIFHMSRCGSTLISQMLAALPQNIVLSEPRPLDFILRAHLYKPQITEEHRIACLQWFVNALGQPGLNGSQPEHLFIKFGCWHTLDLPLIERAFPGVPWIFVYRDPVEVLVSNLRHTAGQMLPNPVAMALFGLSLEEVSAMSLEEYLARYLAHVCTAVLEQPQPGRCVNYRDLPAAVWEWLPAYFNVSYSAAELDTLKRIGQFNAKEPARRFTPDSQTKQEEASELVRQMAEQWLQPLYQQLEMA